MITLLNSSKTMVATATAPVRPPRLIAEAAQLAQQLATMEPAGLATLMHISPGLAAKTHNLMVAWSSQSDYQGAALDVFQGDIFQGLRSRDFTAEEREFADAHLLILSGLYGAVRPLDGVMPYRLELMYKLSGPTFTNLYEYWGGRVADCLPPDGPVLNLASEEYFRVIEPYVEPGRVVSPWFLTRDKPGAEPKFTAVHAKVARGAMARWIVKERVDAPAALTDFSDLGYRCDPRTSTASVPVFVREGPLSVIALKQL